MNYFEYREFKNMIEIYLDSKDENLLIKIQDILENNKEMYDTIVSQIKYNPIYITLFITVEQKLILAKYFSQIGTAECKESTLVNILFFLKEDVLEEVLYEANQTALRDLRIYIENQIKLSSSPKFYDTANHYFIESSNFFLAQGQRRRYKKLLNKIKKFIKK